MGFIEGAHGTADTRTHSRSRVRMPGQKYNRRYKISSPLVSVVPLEKGTSPGPDKPNQSMSRTMSIGSMSIDNLRCWSFRDVILRVHPRELQGRETRPRCRAIVRFSGTFRDTPSRCLTRRRHTDTQLPREISLGTCVCTRPAAHISAWTSASNRQSSSDPRNVRGTTRKPCTGSEWFS